MRVHWSHNVFAAARRMMSLVLLLALLLQSFSRMVVIARFYADQGYISGNLCENRFKPAMLCYGRCQLNKKLKETNDDSPASYRPDSRNEVVSSKSFYPRVTGIACILVRRQYTPLVIGHPIDRSTSCFHPPGSPGC